MSYPTLPTAFAPVTNRLHEIARHFGRLVATPAPEVHGHRDLVNLPGLSERIAALHAPEAGRRSIELVVDIAPDAVVLGDPENLRRIMDSLMMDALDGTPEGGCVTVTGEVSKGMVSLSFSSHSSRVRPPTSLQHGPRFFIRLPVA